MVRLSQDFSLNYPLVDGHGNFGNVDGDPAAAYRYTEARLSKVGEELLRDIDKDTVDWKQNFSEDSEEPVVLPARLPQLLINGTTGIAVGMACSFVPHNLGMTINAIEQYINNNDITTEELLALSGGPDFPTGGLVINENELLEGYQTGRGRVRLRAKYNIEKQGKKDLLVFYEIPYMTKKSKIVEDIAELAENKEIEGISDVRDESAKDMRLVVEVAKGFSPEGIADILFVKTQLENTYSINNTCLVDGQPETLSFKELINHYVAFQQEIITRRTQFDLDKILKRIDIIEGLIIALANIDDVIKVIKSSDSTALANQSLREQFILNEQQAKSVLAMRLSSLTKLEVEELKKEKSELGVKKEGLEHILSSEENLNKVLIKELNIIAKPYIQPKRTKLTTIVVSKEKKQKLAKKIEPVNISINADSVVTFVTATQFKSKMNKENSIYQIATDTGENIIVFMSDGKVYRVPVEDLQQGDSLRRILNTNPEDHIVNVLTDDKKEFIVFLTKQGMIKKTALSEYANIKRTGVMGIRLRDGDSVAALNFVDDEDIAVMASDGQVIRFKTGDITPTGRNSMGVLAIKLNAGATAMDFALDNKDKEYFLTISENGIGKKTLKTEYPIQNRNGKGVRGIKINEGDRAFGIGEVSDEDEIIFYGTGRLVKTKAKDISIFSRSSVGNILIKDGKVTNIHLI